MTGEAFEIRAALLKTFQHLGDFQASFCDLYTTCDPQQRTTLRQLFQSETTLWPRDWRNPFATENPSASRQTRLRQSLILLSARGGLGDPRDDLMAIAATYHNLLLINVDANAFLRSVAMISNDEFSKTILNFADRSEKEKSLKTWCLRIVQTPEGPVAEST